MKSREETLAFLNAEKPLIAPSMLKCDFGNLEQDIERLENAGAKLLHLDVMDGHFVPNLSYGPMVIERMRDLTEMVFDAHLMISEPDRYLAEYLKAGCECITFHIEAVPDPTDLLKKIRDAGVVSGISLNPGTPVSAVQPYLEWCDLVLVMSVNPGFGGQAFMPVAIEKLQELRGEMTEQQILSVDGGIATETIGSTASAGADLFVCGSSVFNEPDYSTAISDLHRLASEARSAKI